MWWRSFASTSISVLAGAYAAALVAGGSARGSTVTRLLGIGLIGLVIVKLYLYDVWLLAPLYRLRKNMLVVRHSRVTRPILPHSPMARSVTPDARFCQR